MSGLEHETYRSTAFHIARAEITDDEKMKEICGGLPDDKRTLIIEFASRMIELGMDTEAGMSSGSFREDVLAHETEIYLQGAAEANETNF